MQGDRTLRKCLLCMMCVAGLASRVHAQAAATQVTPSSQVAGTPSPRGQAKHEGAAVALSTVGTLAGAVTLFGYFLMHADEAPEARVAVPVGITGLVLAISGPAWGHWYARDLDAPMLAIRGVSALGTVVAVTIVRERDPAGWQGLAQASLLVLGVTSIIDIATAPSAVRRHNQRLMITPLATRDTSATGLQLIGRF